MANELIKTKAHDPNKNRTLFRAKIQTWAINVYLAYQLCKSRQKSPAFLCTCCHCADWPRLFLCSFMWFLMLSASCQLKVIRQVWNGGGMWTYMKHRRDTKQTACVSLHILVNIHQGAKQAPDLAIHDKLEITLRARRQICHADYTTWNCISPWPVSCLYRSQSFSIAVMYISRYCCTSSSVGLSIWGNSTGVPITTWTGTWVTKSAALSTESTALSHRVYSIKSHSLQHSVTESTALSHRIFSTEWRDSSTPASRLLVTARVQNTLAEMKQGSSHSQPVPCQQTLKNAEPYYSLSCMSSGICPGT